MPMAPRTTSRATRLSAYPHRAAFAIQIGRNPTVQAGGIAMVSLMGLTVIGWPAVLAWTVVAVLAAAGEDRLLRIVARGGRFSQAGARWAPALRILVTTLYAAAALALIVRGGSSQRLFAFALLSASMVHGLMRYYRSPLILVASFSPYLIVLSFVAFSLARTALEHGQLLLAFAATFTIATFALQIWSARAQLSGAWMELTKARERAEERERAAQSANLAKSQFLTTMSHELRTPLNGVLGMAQALAKDPLTRVQQERVKVIRQSGESLLAVLNDLLDLSKIETGSLEIEVAEFDLEELVRGVVAAYQALAKKKGLTFELEIADDAGGRYLGDSARIRRILYSLCDNAVKFTLVGGASLSVARRTNQVVFCVADTGIGIGACDLAHLSEGFFQADASLTRLLGGTGVGLTICSELTKLMGGQFRASSELGKGSQFEVSLPLELAKAASAPKATNFADKERPLELRVLAAEDNDVNQLVLKTLLAPAGICPTMVDNGREALAAWEAQTWDIVLMDVQMPEMDGIEATRAIRLRETKTGRARTPIVAVTANAMAHQLAEYEAAGMDGVVAKPFEVADLFEVMGQALAQVGATANESGSAPRYGAGRRQASA